MLYEASHDDIEKVSDQAWNHVADTQTKAFLRGFCFGLLSVFVSLSLCCPGWLSLFVITLKWQFWRGDEASVVLPPLQNVLELMCTDSSVNGEGKTLACPPWLAQRKPVHLGELPSNWQTPGTAIPETGVLQNCPLFSPSQGKRLKIWAILYVFFNAVWPVGAWISAGNDSLMCFPLSAQWGCFPGSAPYCLCDGDNEYCSWGLCMLG